MKRRYKAKIKAEPKTESARNTPLFAIKLRNMKSASLIMAHIYRPARMRAFDSVKKQWMVKWTCLVRFVHDGNRRMAAASGPDWLASVLLAVDFVRMRIPENQDRDWIDSIGGEVWSILPRRLPVSTGYELYRKLADFTEEQEDKHAAKRNRELEIAERKASRPRRRRKSWPDPERATS